MSSSNHIRTLSPLHSKKGLGTKFDSDRSIDSHVIETGLQTSITNLDWIAQSTIKVNLLLKVLLKLIMNYICCTNGN